MDETVMKKSDLKKKKSKKKPSAVEDSLYYEGDL
jgi:hypothetical protein